jgi:hypothetical protein
MKKVLLIIMASLLTFLTGQGQDVSYIPGEKVTYVVHYGLIHGGYASFELFNDTLNNKEYWHSRAIGQTTGVADAIFRIKDVYESYIDPQTDLPYFTIRNIKEGRYRRYNEVTFDHKTRSDSTIILSDRTGKHIAPPRLHDILSCFYFFRKNYLTHYKSIKKGDLITIMTWFTDELYPIKLRYLGIEEVRTRMGKIKCLKFNPVTETGRLFQTEEDMSIWFSADKNYLPVKIRFDIFVGSITVDIISYEGLANTLEIKAK